MEHIKYTQEKAPLLKYNLMPSDDYKKSIENNINNFSDSWLKFNSEIELRTEVNSLKKKYKDPRTKKMKINNIILKNNYILMNTRLIMLKVLNQLNDKTIILAWNALFNNARLLFFTSSNAKKKRLYFIKCISMCLYMSDLFNLNKDI